MMIEINRKPADTAALSQGYPEGGVERKTIDILGKSEKTYRYSSEDRFKFELMLRREIVNAAYELGKSRMAFRTFHDTACNPDYWDKKPDGGFELKNGVKPSDAIRDIYKNGYKYGTECATAMQIIYYKALLEVFSDEAFNRLFDHIYLMNWHRIDASLREVGQMQQTQDFLPGDRRYFMNPDVDPTIPEFQGENVIDLGNGKYYGHGLGIYDADKIVSLLNKYRKEDADNPAYLMDLVGRPDFNRLANLYERENTAALSQPA